MYRSNNFLLLFNWYNNLEEVGHNHVHYVLLSWHCFIDNRELLVLHTHWTLKAEFL